MRNIDKKKLPNVTTYLRYPGGKSRYIKRYIIDFIPDEFNRFIEPFAGGASVSIFFKKLFSNNTFWINDIDYNLYCFWMSLRDNTEDLYNKVKFYKDTYHNGNRKELFKKLKSEINNYDNIIDIAVAYYVLNKTSFSGLTQQGNFTPLAWDSNFSYNNIEKLRKGNEYLKDIYITNKDYSSILEDVYDGDFIFLDPPYDIDKFLYGNNGENHRNFDHYKFNRLIKKTNKEKDFKFLITYNDNEVLRDMYKEFYIYDREFNYVMNFGKEKKGNKKNEIFITNFSIENNEDKPKRWF
ncbi:MAG: DNA adenine methylase [Nanoarchaeota archaeon]